MLMLFLLLSIPVKSGDLDYPLASARLKLNLDSHPKISTSLNTEIRSLSPENFLEEFIQLQKEMKPDFLGISCYIWNREAFLKLAKLAHSECKAIICGGPDATASPQIYLNSGVVDWLISGEGEESLPILMDALIHNRNLPNYPWLGKMNQKNLPRQETPVIFNSQPSPLINKVVPLNKQFLWELTRGCPYNCAFCYEARGIKTIRNISWETFTKEAKEIALSNIEEIFVLDPTFNYDPSRCVKILQYLIEQDLRCHFTFEIRMEKLQKEQIELLSCLSCSLQIGLQSADPKVCRKIHRHLDRDSFRNQAELLRSFNIAFGLDLIYGLPGDTLEGFRDSILYALELGPSNLDIFPLLLLEGTELFEKADEWGIHQGDSNFNGWEHPSFPEKDMLKAREWSNALEELYSFAMAPQWFLLLCSKLCYSPIELIEDFHQWKLQNTDFKTMAFIQEKLHSKKDVALLEYIILLQALDCLNQGSAFQVLELFYSPEDLEDLPQWDEERISVVPSKEKNPWVLFLSDEGVEWECLSHEAASVLKAFQEGSSKEEVEIQFPDFPLKDFLEYGIDRGFLQ